VKSAASTGLGVRTLTAEGGGQATCVAWVMPIAKAEPPALGGAVDPDVDGRVDADVGPPPAFLADPHDARRMTRAAATAVFATDAVVILARWRERPTGLPDSGRTQRDPRPVDLPSACRGESGALDRAQRSVITVGAGTGDA
jgi:hypothetical protein